MGENEKELFKKICLEEFSAMKPALAKFSLELVDGLPSWFWTEAASSTGKHHPTFSLGGGGLARHSLMVYRWLKSLIDSLPDIHSIQDTIPAMMFAALFHDCCKRGDGEEPSEHTRFEHPILAAKFIMDRADKFIKDNKEFLEITVDDEESFKQDIAAAVSCIQTHMGRFNTNSHSEIVLPLPRSAQQQLVHLADYCASRKFSTWDSEFFQMKIED